MEIAMQRTVSKPKPMDGTGYSAMSLVRFFKTAKEDMERRGKEDEAFVLEMLEEHFRECKPLEYGPMVLRL
jgi:hypothetical protein